MLGILTYCGAMLFGVFSLCIYRIRVNAALGFYFLIWVLGWGSIQKILQKVDFSKKKTPKVGLFTLPGALFKSGAALTRIR